MSELQRQSGIYIEVEQVLMLLKATIMITHSARCDNGVIP